MWKALAGGTKSWILSHQGEVDATFGGVVLIVMYTRNHMTVDTRIPTNPGQSRSGFSLTRQTLPLTSANRREVFGESHEG